MVTNKSIRVFSDTKANLKDDKVYYFYFIFSYFFFPFQIALKSLLFSYIFIKFIIFKELPVSIKLAVFPAPHMTPVFPRSNLILRCSIKNSNKYDFVKRFWSRMLFYIYYYS